MASQTKALEVYSTGSLTVIGFYGRTLLHGVTALDCRDQLMQLAQEHKSVTFAFDLTRLKLVPSGMLGLFAAIKKSGIDVLLFNPGPDIREVLEITKLDTILNLFEIEIPA